MSAPLFNTRWTLLHNIRAGHAFARAVAVALALSAFANGCRTSDKAERAVNALSPTIDADSMGAKPTNVRSVATHEPADLLENSAAVMSATQSGIFFTVNDSGNDPALFALDTAGNTRGRWKVGNATNRDWEAASRGTCIGTTLAKSGSSCLFVGDVGDNGATRPLVTLYQVPEPMITKEMVDSELTAEHVVFRYPDGPHDVESMYVGPKGDAYFLTKRALPTSSGKLRPSLVFVVPAAAWSSHDTVTARLLDSLPIVPGSSEFRQLTDASLSIDAKFLAVRTYGQVYTFVTDSTNGRVINTIPPAVCNIEKVEARHGEGITWVGNSSQFLLTREGRDAPLQILTCPLPQR